MINKKYKINFNNKNKKLNSFQKKIIKKLKYNQKHINFK